MVLNILTFLHSYIFNLLVNIYIAHFSYGQVETGLFMDKQANDEEVFSLCGINGQP